MNCRFVARDQPRAITGRHDTDCDGEPCTGCEPCTEPHCRNCRRAHAHQTCAECLAATRDDLHQIATLCDALPQEVQHRGINGEAMMLLGPACDPEAWGHREASALAGRVPAEYLEDARDEQHPLFVLGSWEMVWREHMDQPTDLRATLPRLVDYLDRQLHHIAAEPHIAFEDMARDLRACKTHLEDVLRHGERDETGAPCPECDRPLVKDYGDHVKDDKWTCRACKLWWTDHDYRTRVDERYLKRATALSATDMHRAYGIKPGSVRGWASKGEVTKRGHDANGLQLYDVETARTAHARNVRINTTLPLARQ